MRDDEITRSVTNELFEEGWLTPYEIKKIAKLIVVLRGEMEGVIGDTGTKKTVSIPLMRMEEMEGGHSENVFLFKYPFTGRLVILRGIKDGTEKVQKIRNKLYELSDPNLSIWHGMGKVGEQWQESAECSEFVPGKDLKKTLKEQTAKPEFGARQRLQILLDIINGALALHKVGLFHRDIKPANTIVSPTSDGGRRAMLIDYGLVTDVDDYSHRLLKSKSIAGTASYVPPYIFSNHNTDLPGDDLLKMLTSRDSYAIGQTAIETFGGHFQLIDKHGEPVEMNMNSARKYQRNLLKTALGGGKCRVIFAPKRAPWARPGKNGLQDKWEGRVKLRSYFNGGRFSLKNLETLINELMQFNPNDTIKLTTAKERVEEMLDSLR